MQTINLPGLDGSRSYYRWMLDQGYPVELAERLALSSICAVCGHSSTVHHQGGRGPHAMATGYGMRYWVDVPGVRDHHFIGLVASSPTAGTPAERASDEETITQLRDLLD